MSDVPPQKGKGNEKWSKDHDALLVKGIIEMVMLKSNKASLYALPGIVGVVDNNGGDRVNKKVKEILKNLAKSHDVDPDVVTAATAKRASPGEGSKQARKRARVKSEE